MDYDPSADLEKIKARLLAINFADDAVNPPELGVLEAGVARIRGARCVVVPASPRSQGHQNASNAAIWKEVSSLARLAVILGASEEIQLIPAPSESHFIFMPQPCSSRASSLAASDDGAGRGARQWHRVGAPGGAGPYVNGRARPDSGDPR